MPEVKYWEDVVQAPVRRFGPLTFPAELLDQLLELMGEKHPIHDDPAFAARAKRTRPIVPGGFIHSITSGWIVQHGAPAAIVGMRSMYWDFVRPLYPDVPFYFTTQTSHTEEIDERVGRVDSVRRVVDEADRAYAIGRLSVVMLRRSAAPRMEAKVL
jgi:acyl dehydratase